MKNLLLCFVLSAFVFGCDKGGCDNGWIGKLDPNAMVSLISTQNTKTETPNTEHLSALEIVKQAEEILFWNHGLYPNAETPAGRRFADEMRDLTTPKLLMYGLDVIDRDTTINPYFIEAVDIVLVRHIGTEMDYIRDTIAYIPNKVIRSAEAKIKTAFAEKNFTLCYEIFDKEFTYTPITGAEWRELKAKNEQ